MVREYLLENQNVISMRKVDWIPNQYEQIYYEVASGEYIFLFRDIYDNLYLMMENKESKELYLLSDWDGNEIIDLIDREGGF